MIIFYIFLCLATHISFEVIDFVLLTYHSIFLIARIHSILPLIFSSYYAISSLFLFI